MVDFVFDLLLQPGMWRKLVVVAESVAVVVVDGVLCMIDGLLPVLLVLMLGFEVVALKAPYLLNVLPAPPCIYQTLPA